MKRVPDGATRFILIRHGETDGGHGICYGRLDLGLSERGRAQAAAAAASLDGATLHAVYASPQLRARDSARPLGEARGLPIQVRDGLREIDLGAVEGLTYAEAAARHPGIYAAWMQRPNDTRFPGGESFAELRARVMEVAAELRAAHAGQAIALVAHGGTNRVLLADALRMGADDLFRIDQAFGGVSVIDYFAATAVVRMLNRVP
jgi:alpha-ribazole phosphatase/probable phosphoglycerate mutase